MESTITFNHFHTTNAAGDLVLHVSTKIPCALHKELRHKRENRDYHKDIINLSSEAFLDALLGALRGASHGLRS